MKATFAVRKDLDMGKGKIAVQVAHAAVIMALSSDKKTLKKWLDDGQKKVALWVKDEGEIIELELKARELKVPFYEVRDAGLTQLPPNTLTCVGFGPEEDEVIDKITGHLKLI